jgi:hypothetical protein
MSCLVGVIACPGCIVSSASCTVARSCVKDCRICKDYAAKCSAHKSRWGPCHHAVCQVNRLNRFDIAAADAAAGVSGVSVAAGSCAV